MDERLKSMVKRRHWNHQMFSGYCKDKNFEIIE